MISTRLRLAAYYKGHNKPAAKDALLQSALHLVKTHPDAGRQAGYALGYTMVSERYKTDEGIALIRDFLTHLLTNYDSSLERYPEADGSRHYYTEVHALLERAGESTAWLNELWGNNYQE